MVRQRCLAAWTVVLLATTLVVAVLLAQPLAPASAASGRSLSSGKAALSGDTTATPEPFLACPQPFKSTLTWLEGTDSDTLQMAYNARANEYLAITTRYVTTDTHAIAGQRLMPNGEVIVAATNIITDSLAARPAVAYSPASDRYLVAWGHFFHQPDGGRSRLMAQPLTADMAPVGQPVELGSDTAYDISVTYNPDDDEFLVLWRDEKMASAQAKVAPASPQVTPTPLPGVTEAIYAARVRPDGSVIGTTTTVAMQVGTPVNGQFASPTVAYNTADHEYLVIWQHSQQGLFGRRLSRGGDVLGEVLMLGKPNGFLPRLVYNSDDNKYLLVYLNMEQPGAPPGMSQVSARAQLLSSDGIPQGEAVSLTPDMSYPESRAAVYNTLQHEYLVGIRNRVVRLSREGAIVGQAAQVESEIAGLGVNTSGCVVVVERWWHLASLPATPTPEAASAITRWTGVVQAIQPAGDLSQWIIGGQTTLVTRLTRIQAYAGPAQVGASVEVVAHAQGDQKVADTIVVQPVGPAPTVTPTATPHATTTPEAKHYPLYLPFVSQQHTP